MNLTELSLSLSLSDRVRLEAFSDNSGKLQLSLQEIIEWLTAKDEELSEQLPIGGDVGAVQHQRDFHQVRWATGQPRSVSAAQALFIRPQRHSLKCAARAPSCREDVAKFVNAFIWTWMSFKERRRVSTGCSALLARGLLPGLGEDAALVSQAHE